MVDEHNLHNRVVEVIIRIPDEDRGSSDEYYEDGRDEDSNNNNRIRNRHRDRNSVNHGNTRRNSQSKNNVFVWERRGSDKHRERDTYRDRHPFDHNNSRGNAGYDGDYNDRKSNIGSNEEESAYQDSDSLSWGEQPRKPFLDHPNNNNDDVIVADNK
jgi:hypothetical protein